MSPWVGGCFRAKHFNKIRAQTVLQILQNISAIIFLCGVEWCNLTVIISFDSWKSPLC